MSVCNMDCFHCIFADCVNGAQATPAETKLRKAADYTMPQAAKEAERRWLNRFSFTPAEERAMAKAARVHSVWENTTLRGKKPLLKKPITPRKPRAKKTPEERRAAARSYYAENREKRLAQKREYYIRKRAERMEHAE